MTRRGRTRRTILAATGLVAAALATALVLPLVVPGDAGPEPEPTTSDPAPAPPSSSLARYLDGNAYLRGVNVYSLIFAGRQDDPSLLGEPQASYDYLAARGHSFVRLAVPWQRLQEIPEGGSALDGLDQPVSTAYLDVVQEQVARAGAAGLRTVIDLHNGCTYPWGAGDFVEGSVRCGDGIEPRHVERIWTAIAERFRDDPHVLAFNIFNEPRWSVGVETYREYAQHAVDAIRSTGAAHAIWVEGILSDSRGRLQAIAPDGPWIDDPERAIVYSEHFYDNERGEEFDPADDHTVVLTRLREFAAWCDTWGVHCAVGEVGWPSGGDGGAQSAASGQAWNDLFAEFYGIADEHELDVAYFAASGATRTGTLLAYVSSAPGLGTGILDTALSQTAVIEAHPTRPLGASG